MPASSSVLNLIYIDKSSDTPVYRQLVGQINCIIKSGQLSGGQLLPTIRALAAERGINPNTVARAYEELQIAGTITKRQGSGCSVSESVPKFGPKEKRALLADQIKQLVFRAGELGVSRVELAQWVEAKSAGPESESATLTTRKIPPSSPKPSDTSGPDSPSIWQPDEEFID